MNPENELPIKDTEHFLRLCEVNAWPELKGNKKAIEACQIWASTWHISRKPLLIGGPSGIGKNSIVKLLAKDEDWVVVKKENSEMTKKKFASQGNIDLFTRKLQVLVITGQCGIGRMMSLLISAARNMPVIYILENCYDSKIYKLRLASEFVQLEPLNFELSWQILDRINKKFSMGCTANDIDSVLELTIGDVRTDLMSLWFKYWQKTRFKKLDGEKIHESISIGNYDFMKRKSNDRLHRICTPENRICRTISKESFLRRARNGLVGTFSRLKCICEEFSELNPPPSILRETILSSEELDCGFRSFQGNIFEDVKTLLNGVVESCGMKIPVCMDYRLNLLSRGNGESKKMDMLYDNYANFASERYKDNVTALEAIGRVAEIYSLSDFSMEMKTSLEVDTIMISSIGLVMALDKLPSEGFPLLRAPLEGNFRLSMKGVEGGGAINFWQRETKRNKVIAVKTDYMRLNWNSHFNDVRKFCMELVPFIANMLHGRFLNAKTARSFKIWFDFTNYPHRLKLSEWLSLSSGSVLVSNVKKEAWNKNFGTKSDLQKFSNPPTAITQKRKGYSDKPLMSMLTLTVMPQRIEKLGDISSHGQVTTIELLDYDIFIEEEECKPAPKKKRTKESTEQNQKNNTIQSFKSTSEFVDTFFKNNDVKMHPTCINPSISETDKNKMVTTRASILPKKSEKSTLIKLTNIKKEQVEKDKRIQNGEKTRKFALSWSNFR